MARQTFTLGTGANSGDGEGLRTAFSKVESNFGELYSHANSTSNPHSVSAAQVGAIATSQLEVPGGVATLDGSGKLKTGQRPSYSLNEILVGNVVFSLTPNVDHSYDLGSLTRYWNNLFVSTISGDNFSANATTVRIVNATIDANSAATTQDILTMNGRALIKRLSTSGAVAIGSANTTILGSGNTAAILAGNVTVSQNHLHLAADDTLYLYANIAGDWSYRKTASLNTDGSFSLESMVLKSWSASSDVDGLISGVSTGSIIEGPSNGHLVMGIQSNDSGDGFFVVDKGDGETTYQNQLFGVSRSQLTYRGNSIAHAGNLASLLGTMDGSGSAIDADLLDGQHGTYYTNATNISSGTLSDSRLPSSLADKTITGTFSHNGLTLTTGSAVDQLYTVTDNLTLSTSWQDTSVNAAELSTGSYLVQVTVSDTGVGGTQNNEVYTGVMSWYDADTNEATYDEILLHRAGVANGGNSIFLQVLRTLTANSSDLKLQISSTNTDSGASNVVMKFRRLI